MLLRIRLWLNGESSGVFEKPNPFSANVSPIQGVNRLHNANDPVAGLQQRGL
jgi:hypothetical protein